MAKLPNVEQAFIDERKITAYLLNRAHPFGSAKTAFFERFGFAAGNWETLRDALLAHANDHEIARSYAARHGQVFEIVGPLTTPDGRHPAVRVVWMIREGEAYPRLVTAVPSRGEEQ